MPQAARIQDTCTGHPPCFPPRPSIQGSPDTFFNGRAAHRQSDKWAIHYCTGAHDGMLTSGSPDFFTNGKQQGRVTDPVSCGSRVATGSPDIFID